MTAVKPLSLKRESGKRVPRGQKFERICEVLVSHGIFHLDQPFSYGIPEGIEIVPGSVVSVYFNDHLVSGIVRNIRVSQGEVVKPLVAVKGWVSRDSLSLMDKVSALAGTSRLDFLPFLLSHALSSPKLKEQVSHTRSPKNLFMRIRTNPDKEIVNYLSRLQGKVLVITDTSEHGTRLKESLSRNGIVGVTDITGKLSPAQRLTVMDEAADVACKIVIGNRSALFISAPLLDHIVVINDWSRHHWERKRPYWNSREVAALRGAESSAQVHILGTSGSLEVALQIDEKVIATRESRIGFRLRKRRFRSSPDTYHQTIKEGLKAGSVLVSVAEKSYSRIHICQRCRSRHTCSCGGIFQIQGEGSFVCQLCSEHISHFRCLTCSSTKFTMLNKGAERIAEELGKAFPRTPIKILTSQHPRLIDETAGISIATFGSEAYPSSGYGGLVLLDGERLTNRPFMRAEEEIYHRWSWLISLTREDASVFLSLPGAHSIAQSLTFDKPELFYERTLRERLVVQLPPFTTVIKISGDSKGRSSLVAGLKREFPTGILSVVSHGGDTIIIKIDKAILAHVMQAIGSLQKYRSLRGLERLTIEVDPYDL